MDLSFIWSKLHKVNHSFGVRFVILLNLSVILFLFELKIKPKDDLSFVWSKLLKVNHSFAVRVVFLLNLSEILFLFELKIK